MTATETGREPGATTQAPAGKGLPWLYVVAGGLGFIAAFVLSVEEYLSLINPDYVASCSLNPIVSCGSVMESQQATVFGFPNPYIGVAAFAVVVTAGVTMLAGFDPPRWFWLGMQAGTTLGVVFVHWLIVESLYDIGALCPYCMVVWVVTIATFWYTTLYNLQRGHLGSFGTRPGVSAVARLHSTILVLWYVAIAAMILQAFWSFWITLG